MPTNVQGQLHIVAKKSQLPFGPWDFFLNGLFAEFFGALIQLPALTFAQIIGGTTPSIAAIKTIQFLLVVPDQVVQVGLHGVNAQSAGFTLNPNQPLQFGVGSMTQLSLYNTATTVANVLLGIGGLPT